MDQQAEYTTLYAKNFEVAEKHMLATRIAQPLDHKNKYEKLEESDNEKDPYSGYPIKNQLLPLCCDLSDLNFLSPGYPLFFQYVKFTIYISIVLLIFSGIFGFVSNVNGVECLDDVNETTKGDVQHICLKHMVTVSSLANKISNINEIDKQQIYNFFTMLILLLTFQIMRKLQAQTAILCDEREITASDYTARVKYIPKNFTAEHDIDKEIKNYMEENALPYRKVKVSKVCVCYECHEKQQLDQKVLDLSEDILQHKLMKEKDELLDDVEVSKLEEQLKEAQNQAKEQAKKFSEGQNCHDKFTGEAYVTFQTQRDLQDVLDHWDLSFLKKFREKRKEKSQYKWGEKVLKITQAAEPSDVFWENGGIGSKEKFKRRGITSLISAVALFSFAFFIYFITSQKDDYLAELKVAKDKTYNKYKIQFISSIASMVICIINYILKFIIRKCCDYDKYGTHTDYLSAYARNLTISQFLNTSIVTLVVSIMSGNIWGQGGLIFLVYNIFFFNTLMQWAFGLFDYTYWLKRLKIWRIKNGKSEMLIQKKLNDLYKYPRFDFATKYATYTKTLLSAALFIPVEPLILVWAILGSVGSYWLDKHQMLRTRSREVAYGSELSKQFFNIMELTALVLACGNLFFLAYLSNFNSSQMVVSIIGLTLVALYTLLPVNYINRIIFPMKEEDITDDLYENIEGTFLEDYHKSNPAVVIEKK